VRRSTRGTGRAFVLVLVMTLCASCGTGTPAARPTGSVPSPTVSTTPSPIPTESCAERVLSRLSLKQRVGQLFLLGLKDDQFGPAEAAATRRYHFGSVWFTETTTTGVGTVRTVADQVQAQATDRATGRIRFFVAANQEGGLIQALRGPGFSTIPSAVDQGRMDPATLRRDAKAWGQELASAGVNMNFAPVMDVVPAGTDSQNQPIGVLKREYGHDPATVAREGTAFLRGMAAAGIATSAKHFPGLGRVAGNTDDVSDVIDDVTTAEDPYVAPFKRAVRAGVPFVMVGLAAYRRIDPSRLAAFSPVVIGQMLRGDLGFTGVVVSDDLGATEAVAAIPPGDRAVGFLEAGGDMIISKTLDPAVAMAKTIVSKASHVRSFRSLVDAAALRVVAAKEAFGLLPCPSV
jgi:beta-N-acetylhexosaminidase